MQPLSPTPAAPNHHHVRHHSVRSDLAKAFRLLRRSPAARRFILSPPTPSSDLALLSSPRPSFTIATEEVQLGSLPGRIAMRYLGLPAFPDVDGMSGGLVVTNYANRTHPLHLPNVMADVRVGRYVRDNHSGEWCILTRNNHDNIVRLQYMRVTPHGARERIGLTCTTDLFDKGLFLDSVLFKCHDHEWRLDHRCTCARCVCHSYGAPASSIAPGLADVAQSVVREGANEWFGTVRVTVVANIPNNPLLNIDDTMTVRSSYQPAIDVALASHLKRLAIVETMSDFPATIPAPLPDPSSRTHSAEDQPSENLNQQLSVKTEAILPSTPQTLPVTPPPLTPPLPIPFCATLDHVAPDMSPLAPPPKMMWPPEEAFGGVTECGMDEIADHFLIARDPGLGAILEEDVEYPMLPADPSTLPGGVETCLDGMDVDDWELDDDCFSLMTSDRDARSVSSALSTAGSDVAPPLESVPAPGDDVVDGLFALNLSAATQTPTKEEVDVQRELVCTSPINAPLRADRISGTTSVGVSKRKKKTTTIATPVAGGEDMGEVVLTETKREVRVEAGGRVMMGVPMNVGWGVMGMVGGAGMGMGMGMGLLREAPRLAPRPEGMEVGEGVAWAAGLARPGATADARLRRLEKERKAEERRKKNRQAAARSNAKKKDLMQGMRTEIDKNRSQSRRLHEVRERLRRENVELRNRLCVATPPGVAHGKGQGGGEGA